MSLRRHIGLGGIQSPRKHPHCPGHRDRRCRQPGRDPPRARRTARVFLDHFPTLGDLEIVRAWACVTPFTPDGLPVFGFSRACPNLFHFTGFKGAFSVAPAAARLLVRALDEGYLWEDGAFSRPRRSIQLNRRNLYGSI